MRASSLAGEGSALRIHLVRHGAKEKTPGDPGLTPDGVRQAALTASFFRSSPVTAVFASPLRRAQESAALIADTLSLPVQVDARLRERADWGDLPGQPFDEFAAMWERATRDRKVDSSGW